MQNWQRILLGSSLSMITFPVMAQLVDSTYLDKDYSELDNILTASYIRYDYKYSKYFEQRTIELSNRSIDKVIRFEDATAKVFQDTSFFYADSNRLVKLKVYKHGLREGALLKFWPNSLKMREELYHADTLVSGHCYLQSGEEVPYFPAEKMAEFPGGMNALYAYLVDNIKYPEKARRKGIEGRVRIKFIIQEDGSVADLKVQKSVEPLLDAEALRVVANMPHWIPGQQEGKNVKVQFVLPITFSLQ